MLSTISATEAIERLNEFNTLIDARSQSEFALDRLPGAVNWPSLTDAERIVVGTEYVQVSPFLAKKRGAALVARNIAAHIEREVMDKPKDWRPLVYCWRGGTRSGALATVLDQIGFRVHRLEGGYQAYRRAVIAALDELPARLQYRVICGSTGSGKSRLLQVLRAQGAQVLDLEALANHRGSVLGLVPGSPQPGQKQFESRVWDALRQFDPARPVYIESESKKVGDLRVPLALIERMRTSPCLQLDLSLDARVALLLEDYGHFVTDTPAFCERLDALRATRGNEVVKAWQEAARAGRTPEVVRELLVQHYDPIYAQSLKRNFVGAAALLGELAWDGSEASLEAAAARAVQVG
ncbi:MAG: tRNA 2-selenouridine(34) synthase MnmH [Burkholderiales bacterium]